MERFLADIVSCAKSGGGIARLYVVKQLPLCQPTYPFMDIRLCAEINPEMGTVPPCRLLWLSESWGTSIGELKLHVWASHIQLSELTPCGILYSWSVDWTGLLECFLLSSSSTIPPPPKLFWLLCHLFVAFLVSIVLALALGSPPRVAFCWKRGGSFNYVTT